MSKEKEQEDTRRRKTIQIRAEKERRNTGVSGPHQSLLLDVPMSLNLISDLPSYIPRLLDLNVKQKKNLLEFLDTIPEKWKKFATSFTKSNVGLKKGQLADVDSFVLLREYSKAMKSLRVQFFEFTRVLTWSMACLKHRERKSLMVIGKYYTDFVNFVEKELGPNEAKGLADSLKCIQEITGKKKGTGFAEIEFAYKTQAILSEDQLNYLGVTKSYLNENLEVNFLRENC